MTWWHWLIVHLSQESGTSNASSRAYDFWSGAGSDIGEIAIIGGVITMVRHHNCAVKGCWRVGHHTTADGHKLCRVHVAQAKAELALPTIHPDHRG